MRWKPGERSRILSPRSRTPSSCCLSKQTKESDKKPEELDRCLKEVDIRCEELGTWLEIDTQLRDLDNPIGTTLAMSWS